jgi:TRAP-type C4-dicarboxylate transport system permease small subunit
MLNSMRKLLDNLYMGSGVLAALFLVTILSLIVLQMIARWTGEVFPGAPSYVGYAMAAASFFAFAHALNRGAHIRVSILLNAVGSRMRRILEVWCFGVGSALAWYFAYHAATFTYWSWKFNDISQGQDASPIWIPQTAMVIGSIIFAISLTDHLLHVIFTGDHRIDTETVDQGE